MSNPKNNGNGLLKGTASKILRGTPGVASMPASSLKAQNVGLTAGKTLDNSRTNAGLNLGHMPSAKKKSSTGSGTNWEKFLGQVATGGISSVLGGGSGIGSLGGLGSIFSDLANLFSSKKTQPALTAFELPAAQNQIIRVGATGAAGALPQTSDLQGQSAAIAQAVKTAILHSSSLNDVIGEI